MSPCLFNLCAEDTTQNARLDEAHAGIKIAWRNINNLRYTDDTTLIAETEEELKSLLMKVKEEQLPHQIFQQAETAWHPATSQGFHKSPS